MIKIYRTYGSMGSAISGASNDGGHARPRNIRPRSRQRTLSTSERASEIIEGVERFGRRTISICQAPPDLDSLPPVTEDGIY